MCLITTYYGYQEYLNNNLTNKERKYNNFEIMKNYCSDNDFLFLIYDVKNSEFFRFDENDKLIKTNLEFSQFENDEIKIFKNDNDIKDIKKINYNFKLKTPTIIGKIKPKNKTNFTTNKLNSNFDFEMIGKNIIFYNKNNFIQDKEIDLKDDEKEFNDSDEDEMIEENDNETEGIEDSDSEKIKNIEKEGEEDDNEIKEPVLNVSNQNEE